MKRFHAIAMLSLFLITFTVSPLSYAFGNLKNKIQKELDVNPFLKKQGIKLRVTDETSGYVSIEMYQGNRVLRARINDGSDILSGQIEQQWFLGSVSKDEKESVTILRRTLGVIKNMEGVKEVLLTAVVNELKTTWSQFSSALKQGDFQYAYDLCSDEIKKEHKMSFEKFKEIYSQESTIKSLAEIKIIREEYKEKHGMGYSGQAPYPLKFIYENGRWLLNDL